MFRECEERKVRECRLEVVSGLCADMKIVQKCQPVEDCDMFSCKSLPDTRLEAHGHHSQHQSNAKVDMNEKQDRADCQKILIDSAP